MGCQDAICASTTIGQELARNAERITNDDLYTLRVRTLEEPGGPPAPAASRITS